MTNEIRKKEIIEKYGQYLEEDGLVKTLGQGWHLVLKDQELIKFNKGSKIVKGKNPGGLAEGYAALKQLVSSMMGQRAAKKIVEGE